ncbi:EcsC family protein [Shewanella algicola]|uniref:EcsC family protein n=1 Tax=Shewanella algicola TaxID=640633 RepID=UPI00249544AB|nr:EcsC family protein [Shewanella algicola]
MNISKSHYKELVIAKSLLENPGLAVKISHFIGTPIEKGLALLPANWNKNIAKVTEKSLMKASEAAIFTMKDIPGEASSNRWHKFGAAVSGGVGGFFGLTAIAVELPVSTTIMLRSIADIARSEGELITSLDTKMACLEVFALGGASDLDDSSESGYFAVRAALAKSVSEAAEFMVTKGITDEAAPLLVKLISNIAEKFGIQVTQKAAAQALPAIGAAGGAMINTVFIDHFQDMARGHFIVRKLERLYGYDTVRTAYNLLPNNTH